jgi:hypothetical protein
MLLDTDKIGHNIKKKDKNKKKNTLQKAKKMSNMDCTKIRGRG